MLSVGADGLTLVLSGRWKIESCFQLYFSSFNTFFTGIRNVRNFSLQRGGRCRIYYTNAKQVVILQSGSSECYYGPDRRALLTPHGKKLPELPWKPQVRIRRASRRVAGHVHPSSRLSLCSLHSVPLGTTQQAQQGWGWRPPIAYPHLRRCKPGWTPGRPQARNVPSPNTHRTIQNKKMAIITRVSPVWPHS